MVLVKPLQLVLLVLIIMLLLLMALLLQRYLPALSLLVLLAEIALSIAHSISSFSELPLLLVAHLVLPLLRSTQVNLRHTTVLARASLLRCFLPILLLQLPMDLLLRLYHLEQRSYSQLVAPVRLTLRWYLL
jgi:hypothetical protein